MKILKFNESLSHKNTKDISKNDLNSLPKEELDRILICHNDGQGDTNCYTYDDIFDIISDSDIKHKGNWTKGIDIISNMKPSEILDEFCKDLSYNMTEYVYFDVKENKYKKINWI